MSRITLSLPIITAAAVATALAAFAGPVDRPADQYGRLYADGNRLLGERSDGKTVQLKGPSLQWSVVGWGSDKFFLAETVEALVDGWGAQVIRVPLGIASNDPSSTVNDGYNVDPDGNWGRVERAADAAIERGVYAIVDWHSHSAHNSAETALAVDFFTNPERAGKYGNNDAVIFEIYNEPTDKPSWTEVRDYSNAVIKAIRDAGFNNLILVGSPHWDTETDIAAADPPEDPMQNTALTFHFYAAAHKIGSKPYFSPAGKTYRSVVQDALDAGFPVFVSEWGTNDASDNGAPNFAETDKWHAYLDSNKISSCAWGVTASGYYGGNVLDYWSRWGNPLHFDYSDVSNWTDPFRMTPHGRYIYRWLTGKDTTSAPSASWPQFSGRSSAIGFPPSKSGSWSDIKNEGGKTELNYSVTVDGTLQISYKLDKGTYEWDPYVGVLLETGELSRCEYGIGYEYKGSAHALRAEQSNVTDWDYHINYKPAAASADWVSVRIPWGYFWQEEWDGVQTAERDPSLIENITWYIIGNNGRSGELSVKNAQCLGDPDGSDYVSIRRNGSTPKAGAGLGYIKASNRVLNLRIANAGKVDIFDLKGSKLRTIKLKSGNHVLRMNNLPGGMYMIKASSVDGWTGSVKMMIN
jgi:endoglucanase